MDDVITCMETPTLRPFTVSNVIFVALIFA